ncbi:MAG: FtsH protease activity modulator HflK [Pirellulaceae bacterium]
METREFHIEPQEVIRRLAIPLLILIALLAIGSLVMKGFYTVRENENAVVLRFGKFLTTTQPGFHFCVPFVDEVLKVNVTEERRLRLPVDFGPGQISNASEEATLMLTGDLNAASVEWTVQWRISDPKQKLFSFYDPRDSESDAYLEQVVNVAARSVMNRLIGDYSIDEVLTEKRPEIRLAARNATQAMLDQYVCGVTITGLQMQRVRPPLKVRPSFDSVNASIQQKDKLENEANKERNELIPTARAESDKKIREAEGYAARQRAEVDGEIEALRAKYAAYKLAPDVTRKRLYLESMETILNSVDQKIIIDSELNHVLPLLQLQEGGTP